MNKNYSTYSFKRKTYLDLTPCTFQDKSEDRLRESDVNDLTAWFQAQLGTKASKVKTTKKLHSHPCVVTVEEMAAARHFIKTQVLSAEDREFISSRSNSVYFHTA